MADYNKVNVKEIDPQLADQTDATKKAPVTTAKQLAPKKKNIFQRIANAIIDPEGIKEVKTSVKDAAIRQVTESTKSVISSAINGAVSSVLYGNPNQGNQYNNYGRTNYNRTFSPVPRTEYNKPIQQAQVRSRVMFDSTQYLIPTRQEAESVVSQIVGQILEYQSASVADFYDYISVESAMTDYSWGWKDFSGYEIRSVSGGFIILTPRPMQL